MIQWRIYYGDGSTFDNTQGKPWEAPGHDVQLIVQVDEMVGRVVLTMFDWYYWNESEGEWWASDYFGLFDQLLNDRTNSIHSVKAGRNMSNKKYRELIEIALADKDFPVKSAKLPEERI